MSQPMSQPMSMLIRSAALAVICLTLAACSTTQQRVAGAGKGALAGAVVAGPIGAGVGAVAGAVAGPTVARSTQ